MLFLKLPILALLGIVWWAARQTPDPAAGSDDGGGGVRRRPHPRPPFSGAPRRGPHGGRALPPPARVRSVVARARELHR
jgi:hypothetical protein